MLNFFCKIVLVLLFAFVLGIRSDSLQKEIIHLDNESVQVYNGLDGKWVVINKEKESFQELLFHFKTTETEIRLVNGFGDSGSIPKNIPIFFPFGREFSGDHSREFLISDSRDFIWPLQFTDKNTRITSRVGKRWQTQHNGLDIACVNGSLVVAAADGIVESSGFSGGYGYAVKLLHKKINSVVSIYAHNSYVFVKIGDYVKKGQAIAFSGNTGHTTGPHLHFEVRYGDVVLNPEHFLPDPIFFKTTEVALSENSNSSSR